MPTEGRSEEYQIKGVFVWASWQEAKSPNKHQALKISFEGPKSSRKPIIDMKLRSENGLPSASHQNYIRCHHKMSPKLFLPSPQPYSSVLAPSRRCRLLLRPSRARRQGPTVSCSVRARQLCSQLPPPSAPSRRCRLLLRPSRARRQGPTTSYSARAWPLCFQPPPPSTPSRRCRLLLRSSRVRRQGPTAPTPTPERELQRQSAPPGVTQRRPARPTTSSDSRARP
jgi:hypothetical protein